MGNYMFRPVLAFHTHNGDDTLPRLQKPKKCRLNADLTFYIATPLRGNSLYLYLYIVELRVTDNNMKILSTTQQYSHGVFVVARNNNALLRSYVVRFSSNSLTQPHYAYRCPASFIQVLLYPDWQLRCTIRTFNSSHLTVANALTGTKVKVKVKVKFSLEQATKAQRGSRCIALSLTSALDGVGGLRHAPAALLPRKRPSTHCVGGWVGPRAGLDGCGKSRRPPGFDPRTAQPVASRYQLKTPSSWAVAVI